MAYMQNGLGTYDRVGNYDWMFYPPPYEFADPAKLKAPPQFYAPARTMGLGCGGGCSCGGVCTKSQPQIGLGLFDSADWTTWGLGEWVTLGVGIYLGVSILTDIGKAGKTVRKHVSRRRSRARRKKELQEELATI
jgi:hypothetical protein